MSNLQLDGHKLCHHLEELINWRDQKLFYPLYMDISPTSACNQRCPVCYVNYIKDRVHSLREDVLLQLMQEIGRLGVKSICFQGTGEPLINKTTPRAIVIAKEGGVDTALVTNGVLFAKDKIEVCLSSLSWVRYSMLEIDKNLYNQTHRGKDADWQNVINNIEEAVHYKHRYNLNVTLSGLFLALPWNIHTMRDCAKMCKSLGLDYLVIKPVGQSCWNEYNFERDMEKKFVNLFQKTEEETTENFLVKVRYDLFEEEGSVQPPKNYTKCYGLDFITQIDSDGGIYPCNNFWKMPEFCIGNINDNSFGEIWTGQQKKKVFERIFYDWDLSQCKQVCRHHVINKFLWGLKHPPDHVNFI